MVAVFYFLFGLIIGSFLNVLILRHRALPLGGRSQCPSCSHNLAWFDLIPVISWILLRGKCRYCKSSISTQYPIVELLTGILFLLVGLLGLTLIEQLFALPSLALLIAIFFYDLRHKIIPNPWVWAFNFLALSYSLITFKISLLSLLSGPMAALPLFLLWFISGGRWMGFGDVKLALGIGWLLGVPFGLVAVFFGFVLGATVSVPLLLWGKTRPGGGAGLTMKSEVPFGPFLIASTFILWFTLMYNVPIPILQMYGI